MDNSGKREDLKILYDKITQDKGKPLDKWEIAALLEIYGIRDIDAKKEYGYEDVFEMADDLKKFIDTKNYKEQSIINWEKIPPFSKRVILNYLKGLAFAMPMFVQIFFTLSIGYAIWSGIELDQTKATAIALGTFLALITSGGIAQAIGRKGLFYLKQYEYILASQSIKFLLFLGLILTILTALVLYVFNSFFEILPPYYFFITNAFYFLLSILFLGSAVYYVFEEYTKILIYFLVGVLLVYYFHSILLIQLPEAQFISLVILDIVLIVFIYRKIENLKKIRISGEGEGLPRISIFFYTLLPFFLYGILYFTFLVADRIIAWSVEVAYKPYFIWFDIPYELGLDWALISLVLLMGFTEVNIYEFMYRSNSLIQEFKYFDYKKFNKKIYSFFIKFNLIYLFFSIVIIFLTYFIIIVMKDLFHIKYMVNFFNSYTPFVFIVASISYAFLVNALMNILFIFSFSRQIYGVKSIFLSTIINILVGTILSRMLGLEYAVIGLFVGSVLFWAYSFKFSLHMVKNMEYFYYSAF